MYAIIFELKKNNFQDDIKQLLEVIGFHQVQQNFYITNDKKNGLRTLYQAISELTSFDAFKNNVQDIRAFKIEALSDFTDIIQNGM